MLLGSPPDLAETRCNADQMARVERAFRASVARCHRPDRGYAIPAEFTTATGVMRTGTPAEKQGG